MLEQRPVNLNAFTNISELQKFSALLSHIKSRGFTDIEAVQKMVDNHTTQQFKSGRVKLSKEHRIAKAKLEKHNKANAKEEKAAPVCPDCGSHKWYMSKDRTQEFCTDCRYSILREK